MVRTLGEGVAHQATSHVPPLIVELIGLAGAGKTTLARALSHRDANIVVAADLKLRKKGHIPIFANHAPFLLPVFLRPHYSGRRFTWDEIKAMVYLRGWPAVLRRQAMRGGAAILLDHGPVFKLATLHAFGPERLKSLAFERWWQSMFEQWAFTLDMVIWLDAPTNILVERINDRHQRHAVKGRPEDEAYEFLMRYQRSYEQVLADLTAYRQPTVLQYDTNLVSIEHIVDDVLATCKLNRADS